MYYFAYGSNMNLEHMRRLCGWHFSVIGASTLFDYEFGADLRGYANIRPKQGSHVMGVLYKIDQFCVEALDNFEGYPEVFDRIEVKVADVDGEVYKAWVYVMPAEQFGGKSMKEDYLRRSIAGAVEHHLPHTWIDFMESFMEK